MKVKPIVDLDTVAFEEAGTSIPVRIKLLEELLSQQEANMRMIRYHFEKLKEKINC